jgi:hypothetical protein
LAGTRIVTYNLTVTQTDQAVGAFHDLWIVGGKEESCTRRTVELFHHIEERDRRGRVQIRSGLICQYQRRLGDHRASDGDSLLLTAGQLGGAAIFKTREPDC